MLWPTTPLPAAVTSWSVIVFIEHVCDDTCCARRAVRDVM